MDDRSCGCDLVRLLDVSFRLHPRRRIHRGSPNARPTKSGGCLSRALRHRVLDLDRRDDHRSSGGRVPDGEATELDFLSEAGWSRVSAMAIRDECGTPRPNCKLVMNLRIFDKPGGCWLMIMGGVAFVGFAFMTLATAPTPSFYLATLRYSWWFGVVALALFSTGAYFFFRRQPNKNVPH